MKHRKHDVIVIRLKPGQKAVVVCKRKHKHHKHCGCQRVV